MTRLARLAGEFPVADLLKARASAKCWSAVALAILIREQCGTRPGKSRITAKDTADLAQLLRERCERRN